MNSKHSPFFDRSFLVLHVDIFNRQIEKIPTQNMSRLIGMKITGREKKTIQCMFGQVKQPNIIVTELISTSLYR